MTPQGYDSPAPLSAGAQETLAQAAIDSERAPPGAVLFEVSWETCNQMGGIYQVIRSKAPRMVSRWRNRYWLVGPYVASKAAVDFEERRPTGWIARVIDTLAVQGLAVRHGRWLVPGRPRVLLLDYSVSKEKLDELKYYAWKDHGIEFPVGMSDELVDGVVGFSEAVRRLLAGVCDVWRGKSNGSRDQSKAERRVLAHFHEWLGGFSIPMIRKERLPVAAVFTTHATLLGRYIASNNDRFYEQLASFDANREAEHYKVRTQHGIERACAHGADVFTTVSPITGEECTHLLGRTPDLVLPNGLNIDRYNVGHEFQTLHAQYKERINSFVMGHFFPSYAFDLDKTLFFFTSGRFEPRNKGFDLCLEAMARLNAELKAANLGMTVVFFIVSQRPTRSINPQLLQRRGVLSELRGVCDRITSDLGEKLFRRGAAGARVSLDSLVDEYWRLRFRRTQHALRTDQLPPVVTHVLYDEQTDPVLAHIRSLWMTNRADDPVKIVYHPEFINPVSPLWGIEYEQFVRGCHLGVFPSAYEPWGYTPLECIAMGVPAITSDLAGFGRYVAETMPDHDQWGLTVLTRRGRSFNDAAADLTRHLLDFCRLDRRGRIRLRNEVERRSCEFDWSILGKAYDWSHDLAMARAAAGV